jgi:hypothetical protein
MSHTDFASERSNPKCGAFEKRVAEVRKLIEPILQEHGAVVIEEALWRERHDRRCVHRCEADPEERRHEEG